MKTALKWGVTIVLTGLALVVYSCKVKPTDEGSANTIYSSRFESGEISGWIPDESHLTGGYIKFTASDMVKTVNGGAEEFIAKGLIEGFRQDLIKGDQLYTSWIMDFGTAANAVDMYNSKSQQFASSKEAAGTYPDNVAFVKPSAYGYDGYGVFGKYMLVIWLDGFGANKSEAKNKAVEFIQTFEQKLAELNL